MQNLSPDEQQSLLTELTGGESVLCSGKPNPRIIFHTSDWYMIPFSIMWGGFALFWEGGATGLFGFASGKPAPSFFVLWGIPFVLIGQYLIWGRFFYAAWKKSRIIYAITNRRVIFYIRSFRSKTISAFVETIQTIDKDIRLDGNGTLKFGQVINNPWSGNRNNVSMDGLYLNSGIPVFVDIDDAASAYTIIANLRERALRQSS